MFWTINSRLVQTLTFKHPEVISDYKLSVSDTSLLYIVTKLGQIKLCNWLDGNVTVVWKTKSKLHRLAVGKTEEGDLLYTLEHQGNWNVVVRSVLRGDSKLSSKILLQDPQPLHYLQIAGNGQVLAAAASDFIYVGRTRQLAGLATEDMSYVWRKISVNEPLTCIDLYSISTTQDGDVALAFGCVRGQIYVVNDVLEKLDARSPKSLRETSTDILTPRLLHWHRDAVGALKWSKDGTAHKYCALYRFWTLMPYRELSDIRRSRDCPSDLAARDWEEARLASLAIGH